MMLLTLIVTALALDTSLAASLHWEIDWQNSVNFYGTYATKNLIPRLAKLDGIVQQRVTELEQEIDLNFATLMTITTMMGVVLIMTLHACYTACKQRVDTALPVPVKPVASRVPLVRQNPDVPRPIEVQPIEMDIKNTISPPSWVDPPYKCRN